MKRISLVFIIAALLSAAVIAEGARETPNRSAPPEAITLTGTISIASFPAVLTAGGEEYYVMVPPGAADSIEITDGQEITVEGFVHQSRGRFVAAGSNVITVDKAVIDGTEYVIVHPQKDGYGPRRGHGGMRGGYGYSDEQEPRGGRW